MLWRLLRRLVRANAWRFMPDGTAKRIAYMHSSAWEKQRRRVWLRSQGWCENRCGRPGRQVHHLTYARLYHERLSDLRHLCGKCHQLAHGIQHDRQLSWHIMAM